MAKLTRIVGRIFGSGAGPDQVSQFGSLFAGSPAFTTDPAVAQSLSNWLTGWLGAAIGGNAPAIEDMNSVLFVLSYMICYLNQAGLPEWNTSTDYWIGDLAKSASGDIYLSLTDDNQGNALSDPTNWRKVGGDIMNALGDLIYGGTGGASTRLAGSISTTPAVLIQTGSGAASAAPAWRPFIAPTIQKFLSGSGTYTLPSSPAPLYLRVRMVGGGGGGGGGGSSGATDGGDGGDTTFGTTLLSAGGGKGGNTTANGSHGGAGGSASLGSGPIGTALSGGNGSGTSTSASASNQPGGAGAPTPFGGAGGGPSGFGVSGGAGIDGVANTGSGGSGGSSTSVNSAGGGGASGFVDAVISNPSSTYAYAVGAGGTAGTNGTGGNTGGAGGSGVVIVEEFYQ